MGFFLYFDSFSFFNTGMTPIRISQDTNEYLRRYKTSLPVSHLGVPLLFIPNYYQLFSGIIVAHLEHSLLAPVMLLLSQHINLSFIIILRAPLKTRIFS